jgi:HD superfamily phosphodiesterase
MASTMWLLDQYRPDPAWFAYDPNGIHGISHETRVLVWVEHIADWMNTHGMPVDAEVVRCAAVTHDVGRFDDGRDPEHGRRSAQWVRKHAATLPVSLTEAQRAAVAYCCEWHVPADARAPKMTNELLCLKDADGLDRVRIFDLDAEQLRTEVARSLAGEAQRLFEESAGQGKGDPWEQVRTVARTMGWWR